MLHPAELDHRVVAEQRGRRPVVGENRVAALIGAGDGARQPLARAGVEQSEPGLVQTEGPVEVAVDDLARPARRAAVEAPLARLFLVGEEVGPLDDFLQGGESRILLHHIGGHPPAFLAAVGEDLAGDREPTLRHRRLDDLAHGVDPDLGRDVWLAPCLSG